MKMLLRALAAIILNFSLPAGASPIERVLLISVDGMHAFDLRDFIAAHPASTLADLAAQGIEYTVAHTPPPADSFPGILALTTGGTPATTGVYYDESYSRRLSPPGSHCSHIGTAVVYDDSADATEQGNEEARLDPARLPLEPNGCTPVYPHAYLKVNTIFEVVRQAGGYTAWLDKYPVYELLRGPGGQGLDDLYTPEFGSGLYARSDGSPDQITASINATGRYDEFKVAALLNEIDGYTHDRKKPAPVPTLFGLNLQQVNIAQKLSGYSDVPGKPTKRLADALTNTDKLIGKIVSALVEKKLLATTLIVVTAKHGNGPISSSELRQINRKSIAEVVAAVAPDILGKLTADQGALIWLTNSSKTHEVVDALEKNQQRLGIHEILYGSTLAQRLPSPADDSRSPDIVLVAEPGVIYGKPGDDKKTEHGGFNENNTHVALLLSHPSLHPGIIGTPVSTTQVAPTILSSLGLPPDSLQAIRIEGTTSLPGVNPKPDEPEPNVGRALPDIVH